MFRLLKRTLRWGIISLLGGVLALLLFNGWVVRRSAARVTADAAAAPRIQVALVMGTSRRLANGQTNAFWKGRMDAAAALYKAGKVKQILVSGDNRAANYNEPRDMRDGLVARGVPFGVITLDYAGLRTLDSVIRAHEIFGVTECVIVTDDFHLPRALWLADRRGLKATGFHGKSLPWGTSGKARVREWLARINAGLEEWVLGTGAKHYGEREKLEGGDMPDRRK
ncbi:MAG: ElyC/SanA/YdcF family protein [Verrucomicrobiota bacterium]